MKLSLICTAHSGVINRNIEIFRSWKEACGRCIEIQNELNSDNDDIVVWEIDTDRIK
jgi:hypothetical protein